MFEQKKAFLGWHFLTMNRMMSNQNFWQFPSTTMSTLCDILRKGQNRAWQSQILLSPFHYGKFLGNLIENHKLKFYSSNHNFAFFKNTVKINSSYESGKLEFQN